MKESAPQYDLMALKNIQVMSPQVYCPQGYQATKICTQSSCQCYNLYCENQECSTCQNAHEICSSIPLKILNKLLRRRIQFHSSFIHQLFQIEDKIIGEMCQLIIYSYFKGKKEQIISQLYMQDKNKLDKDIFKDLLKQLHGLEITRQSKAILDKFHEQLQKLYMDSRALANKAVWTTVEQNQRQAQAKVRKLIREEKYEENPKLIEQLHALKQKQKELQDQVQNLKLAYAQMYSKFQQAQQQLEQKQSLIEELKKENQQMAAKEDKLNQSIDLYGQSEVFVNQSGITKTVVVYRHRYPDQDIEKYHHKLRKNKKKKYTDEESW